MSGLSNNHINSSSIDITSKCNFSCKHCFNYSGEHTLGRTELTDQELINEVEQICEIHPRGSCLCGGEPLLRKDIVFKVARKLKDHGLRNVNMVSNGYLIDRMCAKEIKDSGLDMVQISVDGLNRETHDWIRNISGARDKAISAIKDLIDVGIAVGVACTPTKNSIHEVPDLIEELEGYGVTMFRMQPIMKLGRAKTIANVFPSKNEYFKLSRMLNKLSKDGAHKIQIEWGDPTEHIRAMLEGYNIRSLTLNSYGDILLSPYIPITFGNTKRHSILEYMNNGLMDVYKQEFVRKMCDAIGDENDLDMSSVLNLPELYKEDFIHIDIIDDDIDSRNMEILSLMEGR